MYEKCKKDYYYKIYTKVNQKMHCSKTSYNTISARDTVEIYFQLYFVALKILESILYSKMNISEIII